MSSIESNRNQICFRCICRFDAKKFRNQVDTSGGDHSKAAHTLSELEHALEDDSLLEGLVVLQAEIAWIRNVGADMRLSVACCHFDSTVLSP